MNSSSDNNKLSRISLVDNEVDNTSLFRMVLEDNGFVVDVFNDSTLVLANFKPGFYELIILDICMPKMDGIELCRKLRKIDDKVKICFLHHLQLFFSVLTLVVLFIFSSIISFPFLIFSVATLAPEISISLSLLAVCLSFLIISSP
jgi:CheY-like chemotaxis protein